jgi:oxygen-independent coproporphyrinogen III oxidase
VEALVQESGSYGGMSFESLYIGGGTPSLLGAEQLTSLMVNLRRTLDLSGLIEATIEVNPESATPEFLEACKRLGITRLSIGVQSLSDAELKSVGRIHNAAQDLEAIKLAKRIGFRSISADLIAGLPGQTWSTLRQSLERLVNTGIGHLSLYCLSLEEGTPLAKNPPGELPSEDMQAELFERAAAMLTEVGFVHYEISNFASAGHECLHNLNYWRGGEYLGLGTAAASHLQGRRFKNRADLQAYFQDPAGLVEEVEELPQEYKACEEAMLRLRLLEEGIGVGDMVARFGQDKISGLINRLDGLVKDGMLLFDGLRYRLVSSRVLTSNPIFARILDC